MNLKKSLAFGLAGFFMFSSSAVTVSANTDFPDVDESHPNYEAIAFLKESGTVQGYLNGQFKPQNKINRAEFLKIVIEASGKETGGENCFEDVKQEWFAKYVCSAKQAGFVQGYENGLFIPDQEINLAEASKIIANTFGIETKPENETWFEKYVRALDSKYAVPENIQTFDYKITRGDMSEMIWRIVGEPMGVGVQFTTYDKVELKTAAADSDGTLKTFESCAQLGDFIQTNSQDYYHYFYDESDYDEESAEEDAEEVEFEEGVAADSPDAVQDSAGSESKESNASAEYSETNVQVKGVDEADIVKTDGEYIYILKDRAVRVVKAYPPSQMAELDKVVFEDGSFYPQDMYVDKNRLVVLGTTYSDLVKIDTQAQNQKKMLADIYYEEDYGQNVTKVYVFDISDKTAIKVFRELSFEGNYSSSRKVDQMVYVVMNKSEYDYNFRIPEQPEESEVVPQYYDSAAGDVESLSGCNDVLYFPGFESTQYLILAGIPVDQAAGEINQQVVLGASENVYASRENMYVAQADNLSWWNYDNQKTVVHKFSLDTNGIDYLGKGDVPGTILNQFSMDEHNGYFRIATTKGSVWDTETLSSNNVYVLSPNLQLAGKLEGIAPGEQIYSVRFMGNKAYMVTFKKVDPFFVIDVADPTNPKILGKLKIPGFSDYLHPLDENHIIGFGKEAVEAQEELKEARNLDFAWYQGMKIAMFDVTDVENPKELHKVVIGDRGTSSELLYNHKALLFDAAKGIMALPITLTEIPEDVKNDPNTPPETYGDYVYQGAYIYDVSVENGFNLRGRISHYEEDEVKNLSGYYWGGEKDVQRILYIGDYFYTTSQAIVKANDMDDLEQQAVQTLQVDQSEPVEEPAME